ncbi:MAG: MBL fold metallo-hydrolase [Nitrosopumilus sp.]|nr:MBL fold metallo-hydrolase [Nitrosopumilus sp.]MDA7957795.1 MBL fold metallo-hydrolase [Nitrosopumilus sp.]MDA7959128.1 MBL fold metallo-hydrolase [Nitrosopumilus sp.]
MTEITFHGGVQDIGGNKFLVEDRGTRILMDFGMSFNAEQEYFSEFLKARTSNYLVDMIKLGILPDIKGAYRRDFVEYMGYDDDGSTAPIDALLLTHAHVDHCAYIPYLRPDIPIYCSEESRLIMQNFDDTGSGDKYLSMTEKFTTKDGKGGSTTWAKGDEVTTDRDVRTFKPGQEFKIDSVGVEAMPVDHSIPGVCAFILHTSGGSVANTADLRFHGRRSDETDRFVERCGESDLDVLLCEGTRVDSAASQSEFDIEEGIELVARTTEKLVVCGYPIRDLDRLLSFYNAAKAAGRDLVVDLKQAYLLKLFKESGAIKNPYPAPDDRNIRIYFHRASKGTIDKPRETYPGNLLEQDYPKWAREFLDYPNRIDHRGVKEREKDLIFYCNDFKLQELIDVGPSEGSSYIRSQTEPFNEEMEFSSKRIKKWLEKFGLLKKDENWIHFHISGHGDGKQIKKVIDGAKTRTLVPIHTENPQYHRMWHGNVVEKERGGTLAI